MLAWKTERFRSTRCGPRKDHLFGFLLALWLSDLLGMLKPWSQGRPPRQEGGSEISRKDQAFHLALSKSLPSLASAARFVKLWTGPCVCHGIFSLRS